MSRWNYKEIAEIFDKLSGDADGDNPKEAKRLRIVRAASELFIKQGFRKTNVEEIATRAGVAKGTVYLYFKNKADILLHTIIQEKRQYLGLLKPVLDPDLDPRERLRRWLEMAFVVTNQMPLLSRLMAGDTDILAAVEDVAKDLGHDQDQMKADFYGELIDLAARPHRWTQTELEDRAKVLFGLMFFARMLSDDYVRQGLSIERFAEILTDIIMNGLAPDKETEQSPDNKGGA